MIATAANSAWLAACLPEYVRFGRALTRVREEQARVLFGILRRNYDSEFGRRHGFAAIDSTRSYQQRVALRDYEDYRADINRLADGLGSRVLTSERVRLFEPTSGSAGPAKWIPYTASLHAEFQRAIRPWVAGMFLSTPDLLGGRAYWSVSPAGESVSATPSGIPVGFADDSEYVGGAQRVLVRSVMAVPTSVRKLHDPEACWYATLVHLLRSPDLRFMSVWSPSFLTLLADRLAAWTDRLARDVPAAASHLRAASAAERHARLWPRLRVISCWTDGTSAAPARRLAGLFPHARICGKGLVATEGIVSIPWTAQEAAALAVRSHFFEFLPVSADAEPEAERPHLAHELESGQRYSVVLTTGGGLYRYRLGDVVEVVGHAHECPLVRFVSRTRVADWCGEKLHEAHVARVLADAFGRLGLAPPFAMLACETSGAAPAYVLYLEAAASDDRLGAVGELVERGLEQNVHYHHARRLGQLGRLRVFAARRAEASYLAACLARGQRAGDVKPVALDRHDGWTARFEGAFADDRAAASRAS